MFIACNILWIVTKTFVKVSSKSVQMFLSWCKQWSRFSDLTSLVLLPWSRFSLLGADSMNVFYVKIKKGSTWMYLDCKFILGLFFMIVHIEHFVFFLDWTYLAISAITFWIKADGKLLSGLCFETSVWFRH